MIGLAQDMAEIVDFLDIFAFHGFVKLLSFDVG